MDRYLVPVGKLAICAGVLIVCAVILPPGAWWFIVGVALIVAGIVAKGSTEIYNLEYIDRGYENIEEKFRKLGAKIKRIEEE